MRDYFSSVQVSQALNRKSLVELFWLQTSSNVTSRFNVTSLVVTTSKRRRQQWQLLKTLAELLQDQCWAWSMVHPVACQVLPGINTLKTWSCRHNDTVPCKGSPLSHHGRSLRRLMSLFVSDIFEKRGRNTKKTIRVMLKAFVDTYTNNFPNTGSYKSGLVAPKKSVHSRQTV